MCRPWASWLIYTLGIGVLLAAVAWASSMAVRLDTKDALAQRDADLEENVRLALWRMDAALGSLIARENARPYYTYYAYFPVQEAVTSKLTTVAWGEVLAPSPLLTYDSPFVKLHFQFDPDGVLTCPQVPAPDVQSVTQIRYDNDQVVSRAAEDLRSLQQIVSPLTCAALCPPLTTDAAVTEIAALTPQQFATNPVLQQQVDLPQQSVGIADQQQRGLESYPAAQTVGGRQGSQQIKQTGRGRISREQQELRNSAEWAMRQKMNASSAYLSKLGSQRPANLDVLKGKIKAPMPQAREGDMAAAWMGDELMLLRRVNIDGRSYTQGCWLDWPAIESWLVAEVEDLLPEARLEPIRDTPMDGRSGLDRRRLASAAIRLLPGLLPGGDVTLSPTVRNALWIIWGSVLIAAIMVTLLLRGVLTLSERRGSFVSAVTHELRTPLTTFKLYTQLLADDRAPDDTRRRRYVETLRRESDRLGHLVENVLSYARLERRRTAERAEVVAARDLVDRVQDRLQQRVEQAEMGLVVDVDERAGSCRIRTDISAVEQILFNLVDNACKYARTDRQMPIRLEVRQEGGLVLFSVVDRGPGITAEQRKRLFRPFSKSARAAADSAPGVGLGLALSRRLARSLGGELRAEAARRDEGTRFVLTLPVA